LGEIPFTHFFMIHLNLIIYGLFFQIIGLFSAVVISKITSANSMALSIPVLITGISLALETRTGNPFYQLFSILGKNPLEIHKIGFWGFMITDFLILWGIILYFSGWLMVGIIRKLDSDSSHPLNKKQAVILMIGIEIIMMGFLWNSFISEKNGLGVSLIFYVINLLLSLILINIVGPNQDDVVIYLNNPESHWYKKIWNSHSQLTSGFIWIVSGIVFSFSIILIAVSWLKYSFNQELIFINLSFAIIFTLFTFIYAKMFYLGNLTLGKNATAFTSLFIFLSLFIPIPLNYLTFPDSQFVDLLMLNPIVAFVHFSNIEYWGISGVIQLVLILALALVLNLFTQKREEILNQRYRI